MTGAVVITKAVPARRVALLTTMSTLMTAFEDPLADVKSTVIAEIVVTIAAIEWTAPTAALASAVVAAAPLRPATLQAAAISSAANRVLSGTANQTMHRMALRVPAPGAAEAPNGSGTSTVLEEVGERPDPILMPSDGFRSPVVLTLVWGAVMVTLTSQVLQQCRI